MTVQIDERVARCFGLLRSSEFAPLMDYLRDVRTGTLENLAIAGDEKALARLQGKAQVLKELIGNVEQADTLVSKLKR